MKARAVRARVCEGFPWREHASRKVISGNQARSYPLGFSFLWLAPYLWVSLRFVARSCLLGFSRCLARSPLLGFLLHPGSLTFNGFP